MPKKHDAQATHMSPAKGDLKGLETMVGTWKVSGGIQGTQTFEKMEGGFFFIHRFEFQQGVQKFKGIEIIGPTQKGAEPSANIKTRLYSFLDGMTVDYVYEADGETFTYWMGEKGSPSYMKATLSTDGKSYSGEWVYPGGGYKLTGTKVT